MIYLTIEGQEMAGILTAPLVSGQVNFVDVKTIFDSTWDDLNKSYQFRNGDTVSEVDNNNEIINLPYEATAFPGTLEINVVGTKLDDDGVTVLRKATTNTLRFKVGCCNLEDNPDNCGDVSATVVEQIRQIAENAEDKATEAERISALIWEAYKSGELNGKDGTVGKDGADGVSPTVATEQTSTGATITIKDATGTHTVELKNGKDGKDGDGGGIVEETDPTVPSWAKQSSKPSYTKNEVGLGNVDNVKQYSANNPPPYPVKSVNGKTGAVDIAVPTKTSELTNDSKFATTDYVDEEIATFDFIKVVDSLPTTGLPNRIYFVPKDDTETQDLFDEYAWVNDAWEYITTKQIEVDLTDYATKDELSTKQDTLVSGTNIKTINGESILGLGNITVEGGAGGVVGKITALYKGEFTSANSSLALSDNIKNYDILVVNTFLKSSAGHKQKTTTTIVVDQIAYVGVEEYYGFSNTQGSNLQYAYSVRFGFDVNGTTMLVGAINKGTGYSTNDIGIASVYGIKLGSSGGSSETVYSTEETKIGTWVDGKSIYRKVITGYKTLTTSTDGTQVINPIDVSSLNVDSVVNLGGTMTSSVGLSMVMPVFRPGSSYGALLFFEKSSNTVNISNFCSNFGNRDVVIIFEYTKTTD